MEGLKLILTDSYPVNGRPEALDLILVSVDIDSTGGERAEQFVSQFIHREAGGVDWNGDTA